jgi:CubicO group peptidase (beta-lactamase class C family)
LRVGRFSRQFAADPIECFRYGSIAAIHIAVADRAIEASGEGYFLSGQPRSNRVPISQRPLTRLVAASCTVVLAFCLSAAAFAELLASSNDPASLGFSATRLGRIGSWYQERVEAGDLPGAVVAIAKDGKLAYLQAIGFQDRAKTVPMNRDSIFWIASMTKPVTSVAAMMLAEESKLDLDAPVAQYLPELKDMQVGVESTDPATGKISIALEPAKRPMTVRDLLRHTSGLVYPPQFVDAPINGLYRKAAFERDKTLADFVASLAGLPLAHQPGEVWEYSWGIDVLARVVEVASGQPFDQFLDSRIFKPLHMVDTGFYVPEGKLGRLVDAPQPLRNPQFDVTRQRKLLSGGGGLVSTAVDYLRFCQMLLNGGELDGARILTPQTVQEMTMNSLPPGIHFAGNLIGPGLGSSWGLGFAIRSDPKSSSVPGSVGSYTWSGVWGTYFWIDPAEKLIAVQMIQVMPDKAGPYFAGIRNLTYGSFLVPEQPSFAPPASPVAVSADALADYAGTYDFGLSSSSRDKEASFAGIGVDINVVDDGIKVINSHANGPAANAGMKSGDIITDIDGAPVKGFRMDQAISKLRDTAGSGVRLKISREGETGSIDIAVTRARIAAVELQVHIDAGKLTIEATGPWPVLNFEKGKPVVLTAASSTEFYVDSGDHARIAFVRNPAGKVSGMVLNPGPWQQEGVKLG